MRIVCSVFSLSSDGVPSCTHHMKFSPEVCDLGQTAPHIQNILMLQCIAERYNGARRRQICLCFIGLLKKSYQHQIIPAKYLSVYQITSSFSPWAFLLPPPPPERTGNFYILPSSSINNPPSGDLCKKKAKKTTGGDLISARANGGSPASTGNPASLSSNGLILRAHC